MNFKECSLIPPSSDGREEELAPHKENECQELPTSPTKNAAVASLSSIVIDPTQIDTLILLGQPNQLKLLNFESLRDIVRHYHLAPCSPQRCS